MNELYSPGSEQSIGVSPLATGSAGTGAGFRLRDYQIELEDRARTLLRDGKESVLIVAPTGSGKTALTADMLAKAAARGHKSMFIVHRRELIKQSMEAFCKIGLRHGVLAAGFPKPAPGTPVIIAAIQTLVRRLGYVSSPSLIVWDEAHHCAAGSWQRVYEHFVGAKHIGLTATPERLDGKGLGSWFKNMIVGPSVSTLTDAGWLAKYKAYCPPGIDMSGARKRAGDFAIEDAVAAADRPTITGSAVDHYRKHCDGKRALVFACSINHSMHIVGRFLDAGIPAMHIDGETPSHTRDAAIASFSNGSIKVLSNVSLVGEGFDVPGIEAVILLAPTMSKGKYLQEVGRALRPAPGKEHAIILDHVGNIGRHGLPDEEREWSLEGRAKDDSGSSSNEVAVRICPLCFHAQKPGSTACANCGLVFPVKERKVAEVKGDLVEITSDNKKDILAGRRVEQGRARSLEELCALGRKWGYRNPWAWARIVWSARQAKKVMA